MAAPRYVDLPLGYVHLVSHADNTPQNFQIQLGPFIEELEKNTDNSFVWIDGSMETSPPAGFEDYFGAAISTAEDS